MNEHQGNAQYRAQHGQDLRDDSRNTLGESDANPSATNGSQDDDPFLQYFDAEMRYLREAGKEFARAQPKVGRRLGLATPGARDERVLNNPQSREQRGFRVGIVLLELRRPGVLLREACKF